MLSVGVELLLFLPLLTALFDHGLADSTYVFSIPPNVSFRILDLRPQKYLTTLKLSRLHAHHNEDPRSICDVLEPILMGYKGDRIVDVVDEKYGLLYIG